MGRISTGSRSTGSLLTPTPVMVKYALRAQLLARKFGAKASARHAVFSTTQTLVAHGPRNEQVLFLGLSNCTTVELQQIKSVSL